MCFHGHTLSVDSHAVGALESAGATPGPCAGGRFQPAVRMLTACFKGRNVSIEKSATITKAQRVRLLKLGIKLGFCKV
jgi:hypothetical protein